MGGLVFFFFISTLAFHREEATKPPSYQEAKYELYTLSGVFITCILPQEKMEEERKSSIESIMSIE